MVRTIRLSLFIIALGIFQSNLFAQVVTFEPSFATQYDSLIITFDATQGDGGLEGFTGDVYLHTGAITNNSNSDTDWLYVGNGWDEYPADKKATYLGDNKWEFKYKPSVLEFFGINDGNEDVLQVAMLFRGTNTGSGAPVAVGRGDGGSDIYIELSSGGTSAKFLSPEKEFNLLSSNDSLNIVGIGTVDSGDLELILLQNGNQISSTTEDTLRYIYKPEASDADVKFELIATNGAGLADTVATRVTIKEGNGELLSRPAGLQDGITYNSDTSVQLSLFAPGKDFVYVIGDFNDWSPSSDFLMNKDVVAEDSVWFWLEVEGLTPGQQYAFQYFVDGELRVADPYSELVLHPNDDQFIPESTFPNLKQYPAGKTDFYVTVISPGKEEYQWQATDYQRPDKGELVIYELLLRDFLETPNYTTLIDTLDYLEDLGINAIELMPVNEFEGNLSWGYNPSLHMALDKYYGSPNEFKRFVDEAHKRGIAVILDVVLNHAFGQAPIARLWNEGDYGNPTSENPYLNTIAKHDFNVGYDVDHESSITRYYSKRVMSYWLEEYNVDGYRFDLSKGFTQNNTLGDVGAWGAYDQSRVDIWMDYSNHIWSVDDSAYVILEHFADASEERVLTQNGMMVWGNMNHDYNEATMGYSSNLSNVLSSVRNYEKDGLVGYMESHDEQWLMFRNIKFGRSEGDYNIREFPTALDRMELAGAFFFTLPGPKMMWQFGELGYGYGNNGEQCLNDSPDCPDFAPGRTAEKPIRWDYYYDEDRVDLYIAWANMIKLRRSSPAFTGEGSSILDLEGTLKSIQYIHEDTDVTIIGNFSVNSTTQTFDFPSDGEWHDFFAKTTITVENGEHTFDMEPGEYRIFTTKQFNINTSSEPELTDGQPGQFRLYQNYPNPFNPTTNITYDIAQNGKVTLEVFDVVGRKVAELVNETKTAGNYTVRFDASTLSSGIYFARLTSAGTVQTQKMLLLK
jgi:1,4-alpha-glucan branching enzyme